jgi:hypothetical protein
MPEQKQRLYITKATHLFYKSFRLMSIGPAFLAGPGD